jgi:hypothetical protein
MCLKVISIAAALPWFESNAKVTRRNREVFKKVRLAFDFRPQTSARPGRGLEV